MAAKKPASVPTTAVQPENHGLHPTFRADDLIRSNQFGLPWLLRNRTRLTRNALPNYLCSFEWPRWLRMSPWLCNPFAIPSLCKVFADLHPPNIIPHRLQIKYAIEYARYRSSQRCAFAYNIRQLFPPVDARPAAFR